MSAREFLISQTLLLLLLASPARPAEGWKQLFNGEDLEGWNHAGKGEFVVENGALKSAGGMGLLWHTGEKIGNAVIRVVYRSAEPDANSGVFIRIPEKPRDAWFPVHFGYEVQIADQGDEFHRTGSIYSLSPAGTFPPSKDGWNTMEIKLDGQLTIVSVNGKVVNEFDGTKPAPPRKRWPEPRRGPRPDNGYIGLQNHDEHSTVWFREISVRPLEK